MPSKSRRRPVASDRRFRRNSPSADHGPAERWRHSGRTLEPTERAGVLAARATEEHVIDVLVLRGSLDKRAGEAAFRFKLDYQRAGLEARLTGRYSPASGARDVFANIHERGDFEEAAYQRWRNALRRVGMTLSDIVISVVCHDIMPVPDSIPRLQQGLRKLADWYGLPETDEPAATAGSGDNIDQTAAR